MREERGPIDLEALQTVDRVFEDRLNGLLTNVSYESTAIDPVELQLPLGIGFESNRCRFDVQWWTNHGYKYHYTEENLTVRFGWERRPDYPEEHFHPPGNLADHRESCITHEGPTLVTLAVIKCCGMPSKQVIPPC